MLDKYKTPIDSLETGGMATQQQISQNRRTTESQTWDAICK
jgi:hypothetical protein